MADGFLLVFFSEPVFVNVYGLKKFTNTGSVKKNPLYENANEVCY